MLGWFANAIMAGHDNAHNRSADAIAKKDAALRACVEALEKSQRFVEGSANAVLVPGWGEQLDLSESAIAQAKEAL